MPIRAAGRLLGHLGAALALHSPLAAWWFLHPERSDLRVTLGYVVAFCGTACSLFVASTLLRRVESMSGFAVYGFALWSLVAFVFSFALAYMCISASSTGDDQAFSESLDRTSALYFALATASTTGFGDIHATSGPARALVSAQIFLGFVLVVGVFSGIFSDVVVHRGSPTARRTRP